MIFEATRPGDRPVAHISPRGAALAVLGFVMGTSCGLLAVPRLRLGFRLPVRLFLGE
jgi:hypothetical protein